MELLKVPGDALCSTAGLSAAPVQFMGCCLLQQD